MSQSCVTKLKVPSPHLKMVINSLRKMCTLGRAHKTPAKHHKADNYSRKRWSKDTDGSHVNRNHNHTRAFWGFFLS